MLKHPLKAKLRPLILSWLALTLALQIIVEYSAAQYDSGGVLSIIWWVGQLFSLPVLAASELLGSLGVKVAGFAGFIAMTLGIALVAFLLTLSSSTRGSSSARP